MESSLLDSTFEISGSEVHKDGRSESSAKQLKFYQFLFLASFWYGYQAMWTSLSLEILPGQVTLLGGAGDQSGHLAAIYSTGAVVALIGPAVGRYSDRCLYKRGRRRIFVILGALCAAMFLFLMAFARALWFFGLLYVFFSFCCVVASAPYNGLIADLTPESQRGRMSGVLAAMGLIGNLTGAGLGALYSAAGTAVTIFVIVALFTTTSAVTVALCKEAVPDKSVVLPPTTVTTFVKEMIQPLRSHDFRWVFVTRFLMEMGQFSVQEFLLYFLSSSFVTLLPGVDPKLAVVTCLVPLLLCGAFGSFVSGYSSDRIHRRKPFVAMAGVCMALASVTMSLERDLKFLIPISALFGFGFGTYYAVDYALALDVLPDKENIGRDMNMWYLSLVIPQAMAVPIGAAILQSMHKTSVAYGTLFAVTAVYTLLGGMLVFFVKGVN